MSMPFEVGQEVAIDVGRYGSVAYRRGIVRRITPTGRIVVATGSSEMQFSAQGRRIGGEAYSFALLCAMTDEIRATIRRQALLHRLASVRWKELPTEALERIVAALD
jgi:hypothetical protein